MKVVRALRLVGTFAAFTAVVVPATPARAQEAHPMRTWGGVEGTNSSPSSDADSSTESNPQLAPPPSTIGTPIDTERPSTAQGAGSSGASSEPRETPEEPSEAIVHTPGRVGLRYSLEGVEVRGNTTTLARVVLRYVPFHPGDTIDVDDKELTLTRFRLLGTGFFRDVELSLRRGTRRGYVVLVVHVVERNTIVVNDLWLGLSADAQPNGAARPLTAYGGIDIAETNLAGTGITLGAAAALADRQLGLRSRFLDPQFLGSKWQVEAQLLYNHARDFFGNQDVLVDDPTQQTTQDYAVVTYDRFGGMAGVGHDLGVSTQLFFDYRLEKLDAQLPLAASHKRGLDVEPIDFDIQPGSSVLSTMRATLNHDTRDDPFLATRGVQVQLVGDASLTPLGSDYPYAKLQLRAAHWMELPWGHVLKLEGFAGAIFGNAPMFEKFYIGDFSDLLPDRVLDLTFDRRAAPNLLGTDIAEIRYGQYAAKVSAEYRIPIYRGHRSIYGADFFMSGGLYGVADDRDLIDHPRGYSGIGTVPIDLTFNAGLRIETSAGGFVFGVSNFLGFIPVRGQARPQ
ncbi:MAG: BamA/TamA family outer membrane protein [Polyangiaceae bacterium]